MFCAGKFLYALDPKSGKLIAGFGDGGKALLPGVAQPGFGAATAAPAIFQKIIILPGVVLKRTWPKWRAAVMIFQPETIIAWQRAGFRIFWR